MTVDLEKLIADRQNERPGQVRQQDHRGQQGFDEPSPATLDWLLVAILAAGAVLVLVVFLALIWLASP
jgi:hypothetical protein